MAIVGIILGFLGKISPRTWLVIGLAIFAMVVLAKVNGHFRDDRRRIEQLATDERQLRDDAAAFRRMAVAFAQWKTALTTCETSRRSERDGSAGAIGQANQITSAEAARAYRLGRASCPTSGAHDAKPSADNHGGRPAGGVPDLRSLVAPGAFTPTP